jgi:hypothetical protein
VFLPPDAQTAQPSTDAPHSSYAVNGGRHLMRLGGSIAQTERRHTMPVPKGTRPPAAGKGRKPGSQNKVTKAIKDMVIEAMSEAGGVAYLVVQSRENPVAFMTLIGKVIPLQVAAAVEIGGSMNLALDLNFVKTHVATTGSN